MSLFELEKTLSFDEYIGSFDTARVEKVYQFKGSQDFRDSG